MYYLPSNSLFTFHLLSHLTDGAYLYTLQIIAMSTVCMLHIISCNYIFMHIISNPFLDSGCDVLVPFRRLVSKIFMFPGF